MVTGGTGISILNGVLYIEVQLSSAALFWTFHVACNGNLCFVLHCSLWAVQTINFL